MTLSLTLSKWIHQNQCHWHCQCHYMASCLAALGTHRQWHWHCQRRYISKPCQHLNFVIVVLVDIVNVVSCWQTTHCWHCQRQSHCKLSVDLPSRSTRSNLPVELPTYESPGRLGHVWVLDIVRQTYSVEAGRADAWLVPSVTTALTKYVDQVNGIEVARGRVRPSWSALYCNMIHVEAVGQLLPEAKKLPLAWCGHASNMQ